MPGNDREVFEDLIAGEEGATAISFITYALFAFDRREWISHHTTKNGGTPPTPVEIEAWIDAISPYHLEHTRIRARALFDVAARGYMEDEIEAARQETL